jgi:hypothetical protein
MNRKQGLELLVAAIRHLEDVPNLLPLQPAERLNDWLNLADIHLLPQKAGAADLAYAYWRVLTKVHLLACTWLRALSLMYLMAHNYWRWLSCRQIEPSSSSRTFSTIKYS